MLFLVTQSCPTLWDPMDCSPPGSSVHGILQARTLEWGATPSSRGCSQPRDWTHVFHTVGGFFTIWATREAIWHINPTLGHISRENNDLKGYMHPCSLHSVVYTSQDTEAALSVHWQMSGIHCHVCASSTRGCAFVLYSTFTVPNEELPNEDLMEVEAQRKDRERNKEEVIEESKRLRMQSSAVMSSMAGKE